MLEKFSRVAKKKIQASIIIIKEPPNPFHIATDTPDNNREKDPFHAL